MSHPVFLTSTTFNHMPIGQENQWADFFQTASFELEANAFIPILWLMLFRQDHLHWAKYIDELDHDDERNQGDLEEYQQDFSESSYAYLVIDQQQALINLEQRRALFRDFFGDENVHHFEDFKSFILQYYPQHILLRTSGLPLDLNDANFLTQPLTQIENMQTDDPDYIAFREAQRHDLTRFDDYAYFFYGADVLNTMPESDHEEQSSTPPTHSQSTKAADSSGMAIWICTGIVALLTLGVWFVTASILYSVLIFIISAFVLGFISSKIGEAK
ncbi:hypothetical protein [Acinetobacter nematophilus]|uniref:Uncharacterized protein n=1 Tax=Acinetobacter nematophilus TaxID=2994642 RepID=A0A9X3DX20_9GAMM|nr:hypothetical protein [Acinetobacter nematophilus]MCX5468632.1 hypothetical protein [Acinetobacter nematophilus]